MKTLVTAPASPTTPDPPLRYARWRRELGSRFEGRVLELGAGDGANFGYLDAGIDWVGVEPDRRRAALLRRRARSLSFSSSTVLECRAESLPLPNRSVDSVLATLVLCSVRGQARVLSEVQRVLRPGGTFAFLEHVAAPRGTWNRRLERLCVPCSVLLDHGCNPARDTESALRCAGFADQRVDHFTLRGTFGFPVRHIAGECVVT